MAPVGVCWCGRSKEEDTRPRFRQDREAHQASPAAPSSPSPSRRSPGQVRAWPQGAELCRCQADQQRGSGSGRRRRGASIHTRVIHTYVQIASQPGSQRERQRETERERDSSGMSQAFPFRCLLLGYNLDPSSNSNSVRGFGYRMNT